MAIADWRRLFGTSEAVMRSLSLVDGTTPAAGVFALALLAAVVLRACTFSATGLDWDESLYIVIAQRWLHGGVPYVTVWDQHPMGLPALFAAAQLLIGDGLLAARILALLAVAGTATLLYVIPARHAGERFAGALAALLYLLYMSRPDGLAANTEVINNLFVTAASAILIGEMLRPAHELRTGRLFVAALLLGSGLQIKYVVVPEAMLLCGLLLARAWLGGVGIARIAGLAVIAMLGGILPTVVATLYFWQAGALQPYLDANLFANAAYMSAPLNWHTALLRLRFGLLPIAALLPWPLLLAFLVRGEPARPLRLLSLWLAVWLVAAAIDITLPLKFWKHYFNAVLPPLTLTAGLAAALLARGLARRRTWLTATVLGVMAIPALLLIVKHAPHSRSIDRPNVPREVAEHIRQGGSDGRDIYVFNYDPLVYSYTDAVPPTRFVLGIELADFDISSGAQPLQEVDSVLRSSPTWIVVADPSPYAFSHAVLDQLNTTLSGYRLDSRWREEDYIQPPIEVRLYQRLGNGSALRSRHAR
jgi:4-amino-4-deoxy-L-arabinose transferase-like glycosyltransferase